jgi:hypothetical protein
VSFTDPPEFCVSPPVAGVLLCGLDEELEQAKLLRVAEKRTIEKARIRCMEISYRT